MKNQLFEKWFCFLGKEFLSQMQKPNPIALQANNTCKQLIFYHSGLFFEKSLEIKKILLNYHVFQIIETKMASNIVKKHKD